MMFSVSRLARLVRNPSPRLWVSALVGALVLVAFVGWAVSSSRERVNAASVNRLEWAGKSRFAGGANMPWYNWGCDFGCGAKGGVSAPAVRSAVSERIGQLRATGLDTVRWWMFEPAAAGDIWQIRPGANGQLEIDPTVYADIDAALALAEQHDVYYVFVLFSGVGPANVPAGWVNDAGQRQQLTNALTPLFARYAANKRIMAWELFNEPEWQIWKGEASERNMVALGGQLANAIHAQTPALVTVGSAMLDGLPMWQTVALDFYSPHWYGTMAAGDWCALCRDYQSLVTQWGINKPVVIGEWDGASGSNPRERWQHWLDGGYAGAWAWSLFPEKTFDKIPFDYPAASAFNSGNAGALRGDPAAVAPPPRPGALSDALIGAAPSAGSRGLIVVRAEISVPGLVESLIAAACTPTSLGLLQNGSWRLYIRNAPAAVNAQFPTSVPALTALFVQCG